MQTPSELVEFLQQQETPTAQYDDGTQVAVYARGPVTDQVLTLEAYDRAGALLCIAELSLQEFMSGEEHAAAVAADARENERAS